MLNRKLLFVTVGVLSIAAGILLGGFFVLSTESPKPEIGGIYLTPPRKVVDFELISQTGQPFTQTDLNDRWSLLFFGYTFCPDVCPTTLVQLNQVQSQLAKRGLDQDMAVWMVSVDPDRDTVERLKEYTAYFNPDFGGATGDRQEIDKLAKEFGVYYKIHEPEAGSDYYFVDHSATILVINPDARLQAVLTDTGSANKLVEDFLTIRNHYDGTKS